jgi:hypothetical protein
MCALLRPAKHREPISSAEIMLQEETRERERERERERNKRESKRKYRER